LTLLGAVLMLGGLASARLAYSGGEYRVGPVTVSELAAGRPEAATALRGNRGTAAAYAVGYGVLFLSIVLGPYRRGETWAWWTLLAGGLAVSVVAALRVLALGTQLGVAPPLIQLAVLVVGLLLDVGRLKRAS